MSRPPKYFKTKPEWLEPLKLEICFAIERAIIRKQLTQREAAIYMGTSRAGRIRVRNASAGLGSLRDAERA